MEETVKHTALISAAATAAVSLLLAACGTSSSSAPSSLDRAPWQERVTSDHLPAAMVQGALQGRGLPSENGGNVDCRGARPAFALPGKRRSSVTYWPLTTAAVPVAAC